MNGQIISKGQCILTVVRIGKRCLCTSFAKDPDALRVDVDLEEQQGEKELARKRNKSRLTPAHRNLLLNMVPYPEPMADHHESVRYKRRMYGRYGAVSGVDPRLCWPDAEEFSDRKEWESVAHPYTLQEMIRMNSEARAAQEDAVAKREEDLAKKLLRLEDWKNELNAKISKKEAQALAAKAKKDKLVEEVRRVLGFKVDPKDERFKEMLEKKEKEERKLEKEARKKAREAKLLSKLTTISSEMSDNFKSQ